MRELTPRSISKSQGW